MFRNMRFSMPVVSIVRKKTRLSFAATSCRNCRAERCGRNVRRLQTGGLPLVAAALLHAAGRRRQKKAVRRDRLFLSAAEVVPYA